MLLGGIALDLAIFAWLWLFLCGRTYAFVLGSMAAITFDVVRDRSVSFYFMLE
jgi:hypothetical protein